MSNYPEMESYEVVDKIRTLTKGDIVTVWYRKGRHQEAKSIELKITDTGHGNKPLIDAWSTDTDLHKEVDERDITKHYNMEAAGRHEAGYKLRNISGQDGVDGSSIVSIQ